MSPEEFLKEFGHLAETEGGIGELRKTVLRLAIRGRLTEREANSDASTLLGDVRTLREALVLGRQASPSKDVAKVIAPFAVPTGWVLTSLGQATVCRDGQRIPVSRSERENRVGEYDYYGASGVIDKIDGYLFEKPLLLVGEDGANLLNRSTPIAFIARGKYWVNNHAHVLDGPSEDYLRFIELYINAIDLKSYVTGTAQPKMNQAKMNSIPILLPPLPEQKRIVEKVDQLMALCDELEAKQKQKRAKAVVLNKAALSSVVHADSKTALKNSWSRVQDHFEVLYELPENVKELRQTILQLAVMGKLVRQEGGDARPVSESLAVVPLGSLGVFLGGGTPSKARADFWSGDIPWVSPKDMKVLFIDDAIDHISEEAVVQSAVKRIPSGSLLAVTRGMILAHSFPVALTTREVTINQDMKALVLATPELAPYLLLAMRGLRDNILSKVERSSHGTCRLDSHLLAAQPIPVPPLAEQKRIVAKVDQLMALCDELDVKLAQHRDQGQRLMRAVVEGLVA